MNGRTYNGVRFVSAYRGIVTFSGPSGRFDVGRRYFAGVGGAVACEHYYCADRATAELLHGHLSAERADLLVWAAARGIPADAFPEAVVEVDPEQRDALVYGGAAWC